LLLTEYSEQLAALLDGFLGDAAALGVTAGKHPESRLRYQALERVMDRAKNLYRHVADHQAFGFPALGMYATTSEEVQRLIDLALSFGEWYCRADELFNAAEGNSPAERFTPAFEDADQKASKALFALEQAAVEAFRAMEEA
jgi:hypothetical protein